MTLIYVDPNAKSYAGLLDGMQPTIPNAPVQTEYDKRLFSRLKQTFDRDQEAQLPWAFDWELYRLYLQGDQLVVRNRTTNELVTLSTEDTKRLWSVNNLLRPATRAFVAKMTRTIPTSQVYPAGVDWDEQHSAQVANGFLQYIRRKEKLDQKYLEACEMIPWSGNAFFGPCWNPQKGRQLSWCKVCDTIEDGWLREEDGTPATCSTCAAQREQELAAQEQAAQMQRMQLVFSVAADLGAYPSPDMAPQDELDALEPPPLEQMGPLPPDQDPPKYCLIHEGDVEVRLIDPRNAFVDAAATCIEDAGHFTYRSLVRSDVVRRMFPHSARFIPEIDDEVDTDPTSTFHNTWNEHYTRPESEGRIYLYETHTAPTDVYDSGRIIWWLNNGTILKEIESPYYKMVGRLPFFHFGGDINTGEFYREPIIKNAWHRQREYNENNTHIREHITLLLKPKWIVPTGSRIAQEEITATSAQIIKANIAGAGRPEIMESPRVPTDVYGRNSELFADVRTHFGITDQELGISQSDPNARAAAILEAEASQQIGPILKRNNSEWNEMHRLILCILQEFYDEQRTATVLGSEGFQTYNWRDMNLSPGWDLVLDSVDSLSQNPAIRLNQAMEMLNAGRFLDPATGVNDWREFDKFARINTHKSGYDTEATEFAHAQSIPELIKSGQPFQPREEDDPHIHAEVMLGWLRGPGRKYEQIDPQVTMAVRQAWMFYTFWALTGQMPQLGMGGTANQGGAGANGVDQSAPGGTPNNPGMRPTDSFGGGNSIVSQAQQTVQQADQAGENLARGTGPREG